MIYYADYLQENEKRFAIAHELGHNDYILKIEDNSKENRASLFAYIAFLDKNNYYENDRRRNQQTIRVILQNERN